MPFDQLKCINGYNREHYTSVSVRLDKDKVAAFRAECAVRAYHRSSASLRVIRKKSFKIIGYGVYR